MYNTFLVSGYHRSSTMFTCEYKKTYQAERGSEEGFTPPYCSGKIMGFLKVIQGNGLCSSKSE